jgi:hypothetical protein
VFTWSKAHDFQLALPEHLAEQALDALKSSYNLEVEFSLKTKTVLLPGKTTKD